MKKLYVVLFFISFWYCGSAQISVYLRFTTYSSKVLKTDGTTSTTGLVTATTIDPSNMEFFKMTTFSQGIAQTLNIGSQSTGAGAGKVTFNPFAFSRPVDAASPLFFSAASSGTPYKTVEAFFVDPTNRVVAKMLYKLAAIKTINWAAASCSTDCPGVIEDVTVEYGGQIEFVYKSGNTFLSSPIIQGWNRVKNIQDNDPNVVIQ